MKVYFTFEPREHMQADLVETFPEVAFQFDKVLDEAKLLDADVLVTYGEDLTDARVALAKNVQWIFVASAGVEKMPAEAITERGIYVSNVRGIHKKPMTESIVAHILALKRGLKAIYKQQANREWSKRVRLTELNGSTAVILGPGAIGQEIARILQAFDVYTIGCNTSGQSVPYMNETVKMDDMKSALSKADIVISMLPSTEKTKYLLKREHFEQMKDSAIFMNFGRGDVVATEVLVDALENELIAHAVLDVYEEEPLPSDCKLWSLSNVTLSPHVSSFSSKYVERSLEIFKPSLQQWLAGERTLANEVDLKRGY